MEKLELGASFEKQSGTYFKVWAPHHHTLYLEVNGTHTYPMIRDHKGYFTCKSEKVQPGDTYFYQMSNGLKRPDPVSRSLPEGVHGPTEVINFSDFKWDDRHWKGIALREAIFYEVHVGTFSKQGTFDGIINKLPYLKELGVNCLEIMPVAQFPGRFNWGYDGASLYAPFRGYGGVKGLKRLVNAAHAAGFAVCLDVVYNHLGPEGNYLEEFGPYFSEVYHTPWGKALNYDGEYSDFVREHVIKNALYWITEYHIDMLRLDAIHGIYDFSAIAMIAQLVEAVKRLAKKLKRNIYVIAESGQNDSRVVRSKKQWGWEVSAVWNDDFHHAAHVALTNESQHYYQDFNGLEDLAIAFKNNFVYDGKYSAFRKRLHGNDASDLDLEHFVAFLQNHDQVGNRPMGERLSTLIDEKYLKPAACLALLSGFIPLLFMGEEYGEKAPFKYFVDYGEESLMRSVYEGRKKEFSREDMPFPGKESFEQSCLTWRQDKQLLIFYKQLIAIRKNYLIKTLAKPTVYVSAQEKWLAWEYLTQNGDWLGVLIYLGEKSLDFHPPFQKVKGKVLLAAEDVKTGNLWHIPSGGCVVLT